MSHKIYVSFYLTIGVVPKWFKGPVCKTVIRRFESGRRLIFEKFIAWVVELVDTADLKSVVRKDVPVRVRPRVLDEKPHLPWGFLCCGQILSFGILQVSYIVHCIFFKKIYNSIRLFLLVCFLNLDNKINYQ